MFGRTEIWLSTIATVLLICAFFPRLRTYRALFLGATALVSISVLIPRHGNALGQYLFSGSSGSPRLPIELFGIAWWLLGAWLAQSILDLILRRTLFPDDDEPHARRLFADLAAALVYVIALVGIMDTVLKQPISAVLATSGVLAIVLGLALQNTLADVFSGLAINVERPFGAGDWISVGQDVEGQAMEINWRATRIKTVANDMIVIPNSVVAKAIVTNHRRLSGPHVLTIKLGIDRSVPPARAIELLQTAIEGCPGLAAGPPPTAYACEFSDGLVAYELTYAIDNWTLRVAIRSAVIGRVADSLRNQGIAIGAPPMDVRLIQQARASAASIAAADLPADEAHTPMRPAAQSR